MRLNSDDPVEIGIAAVDGSWRLPAELIDLTGDGARLKVVGEALPASVGGQIAVWVVDHSTGIELPIEARLSHRHREGDAHVLGVQFVDLRTVGGLLQPVLGRKFNRRTAFRVTPGRHEGEVAVTLEGPPDREPAFGVGRMVDVSVGGVGLDAPLEFERAMRGRDPVEVSFHLPTAPGELVLDGRIVHRTLRAGIVRYGVMFTAAEDVDQRHAIEAIRAYVVRRQSELAEENELHNGGGIPLGALGPVARAAK